MSENENLNFLSDYDPSAKKDLTVHCPSCRAELRMTDGTKAYVCPVCGKLLSYKVNELFVKSVADDESEQAAIVALSANETTTEAELAISDVNENDGDAESKKSLRVSLDEWRTKRRKFLQKIKFDKWKGWIYLLPAIVLLAIFTVWPIINTVRVSFLERYTSLAAANNKKFEFGFENYERVIHTSLFLTSLKNTILLCVLTVPISTILALLIAVCLNSIKPLQRFLQTIFFLPYVTNSIAIGMVFNAMFNIVGNPAANLVDSYGIMNNILGIFGIEPINWIGPGSSYAANITVLVIYIVWNALPFKILILLGGLQSINKQYYEAAKIDSTPRWRVFTKITVPQLAPMLAYVIITGFIGGFKEYSSIVGIFGESMGAPGASRSLNTMVGYIYDSIGENQTGIASAAAIILFGIIFVVTMINLRFSKKSKTR